MDLETTFFLYIFDNFRLRDEVENTYMEISVSGLIRNSEDPFEETDELRTQILQVKQQNNGPSELRTISKTSLKSGAECFNLNCIIVLPKLTDVFRIQYDYLTSSLYSSTLMKIHNVIIKVKLL